MKKLILKSKKKRSRFIEIIKKLGYSYGGKSSGRGCCWCYYDKDNYRIIIDKCDYDKEERWFVEKYKKLV